jgi:hypothetical protein
MKYFKYLLLVGLMFVFAGCSHKMEYNKSYIETNLKNDLKKVSIEKVDLKKQQIVYLKKRPTGFRGGGTTADINLTAINENVQSEFFKQYFKEVNYVNEATENLFVDSNLYNYQYEYAFSDGNEVELFVKIKVYYKNKVILDKEYNIKDDVAGLSFRLTIVSLLDENFHKTLLKLYETKFKPDLLKALEENQ